jgi:hypothetical protein
MKIISMQIEINQIIVACVGDTEYLTSVEVAIDCST